MDIFYASGAYAEGLQNQVATDRIRRKATDIEAKVVELSHRVDRLALVSQALWEILYAKVGITPEELMEKMKEVDERDGRADGRITPQVLQCPKCGRPANSARPICMYCGTPLPTPNIVQ